MMRALSLLQPYASLVACGQKTIETRSWATSYRGPLAIAASNEFPLEHRDLCEAPIVRADLAAAGYPSWRSLPRAAIVATAELVACLPTANEEGLFLLPLGLPPAWEPWLERFAGERHEVYYGDYSPRQFGWLLTEIRALPEPIPCVGAPGLWEAPTDVAARVEEQLGRSGRGRITTWQNDSEDALS